jgi:hypothetical protein
VNHVPDSNRSRLLSPLIGALEEVGIYLNRVVR